MEDGIGLFKLREFMGALNFEGERFINFLESNIKFERISFFKRQLQKSKLGRDKFYIYLYGSYLRKQLFNDIDILIVYEDCMSSEEVDFLKQEIKLLFPNLAAKLHFQCCSKKEFTKLKMDYDNKQKIF